MDIEAELVALKQKVASLESEHLEYRKHISTLQQQIGELNQFLSINRPTEPGEAPGLVVNCTGVYLRSPESPNQLQGFLSASAEGPCLSLFGADEEARISMVVNKDGARLQFGPNLEPAAEVWADEDSGRGHVQVYEAGRPRALLKADKEGGIVGVVHDDGHARAFMISSQTEGGEIITVTPDMQPGVKISASSPNGGYVTVNRSNGKAGVIIACTPQSGLVVVNDSKGKLMASLPSGNAG